jgi:hypothetical protein
MSSTRGSLARPLTDAELMDKVRLLIDPLLGDGIAASLATAVETIDAAPSLDTLFALCAPQEELNDA